MSILRITGFRPGNKLQIYISIETWYQAVLLKCQKVSKRMKNHTKPFRDKALGCIYDAETAKDLKRHFTARHKSVGINREFIYYISSY
jgi:hypothetical protein